MSAITNWVKEGKDMLLEQLLEALPADQRKTYWAIAEALTGLGYVPHKQQVRDLVVAFKHREHRAVIAKMGIREQRGFVSIKFFACQNPPQKYKDALALAVQQEKGRYCWPAGPHQNCGVCTGGAKTYAVRLIDGTEGMRCGAYPISIPAVQPENVAGLIELLKEQHHYFLLLAGQT